MPQIASRVRSLGTETALDVLVKARAVEARGRSVIHLEVGEPDFPTPMHIVEAGVRALRDGKTRYGAPAGLPSLREAICEDLNLRACARCRIGCWSLPARSRSLLRVSGHALSRRRGAGPGSRISHLRFDGPLLRCGSGFGSPATRRRPRARSRRARGSDHATDAHGRVQLALESDRRRRAEADLRRLAALAERHDLWVMADEIYRRIRYTAEEPSIAALPGMLDRTILVDGFSKAYAMTGWRLGWGLFPAALAPHATRLMINSNTCTASFVQEAGLAALRGPQEVVTAMVEQFASGGTPSSAASAASPAFAATCRTERSTRSPTCAACRCLRRLADRLLEEEAVALLDGVGFGSGGTGHLRLSFASSLESLEEAADRFGRLVARL